MLKKSILQFNKNLKIFGNLDEKFNPRKINYIIKMHWQQLNLLKILFVKLYCCDEITKNKNEWNKKMNIFLIHIFQSKRTRKKGKIPFKKGDEKIRIYYILIKLMIFFIEINKK